MWLLRTNDKKKMFSDDIKYLQSVATSFNRSVRYSYIYKVKSTSKLQNAIMLSSIIGSILASYDEDAKKTANTVDTLRSRIRKFMYKRSRSNEKEFLAAISYADWCWKKTLNALDEKKITIEVVAVTIRLYGFYSEELSRFANINERQIDAFAREFDIPFEIERQSYEVADCLLDELAKFSGAKRKKSDFKNIEIKAAA